MALKPDRKILDGTDISFFCNTVAERGMMAVFDTSTTGLGAAMDDANAVVVPTGVTASGQKVAGMLLCDVVNYDLTKQHINWHKNEVQLGSKVELLRHGDVVTNVITGSPTPGAVAYNTNIGSFVGAAQTYTNAFGLTMTNTDTQVIPGSGATPASTVGNLNTRVGTFKGGKDSDGYVKVEINLV